MFKISGGKGFHVTFENGWTVSVQFGPGNYCDNYDMRVGEEETTAGKQGSHTAECAVFKKAGGLFAHHMFDGDTVGARMTPKQVLRLMNWAAKQKE